MKTFIHIVATTLIMIACTENSVSDRETQDTTNAAINAEGSDKNPYNLPGSDTSAIHQNTSDPGVLDMSDKDSAH